MLALWNNNAISFTALIISITSFIWIEVRSLLLLYKIYLSLLDIPWSRPVPPSDAGTDVELSCTGRELRPRPPFKKMSWTENYISFISFVTNST